MKKISIFIIVIIILAVALFAFFMFKPKPVSDYTVNVGVLPIMASKLPFEIAQQKGFFKDAGINVKTVALASSNLVSDALIRGDIDVAPDSATLPFLNAEMTDPGKVKIFSVTDFTADASVDAIVVPANSSIKSINDLAGKKIGVFPGTTATNVLKFFFKQKGIDSSKMQIIQLPPTDHLTALAAGSVDALMSYEPTTSIGLAQGLKKIYGSVYVDLVNHTPIAAGFLSAKFIQEHPDEAKRVTEAFNRAYDYMRTNDQDTRKINQDLFGLTPQVAGMVQMQYFNYSNGIDKSVMDKLLDVLVLSGDIASKPDMTNVYYKP